jgi:hypothetical protein
MLWERKTHVVNVTERSEECPQGLLRDQWRQPTYENSRIVRVRGG